MTNAAVSTRHRAAVETVNVKPTPNAKGKCEAGIVCLSRGLELLLQGYEQAAPGRPAAEDSYASEHLYSIAHAIVALLNMETGRLDCGAVDGGLRRMMSEHGFNGDSL